jgi:hypothetical protein
MNKKLKETWENLVQESGDIFLALALIEAQAFFNFVQ